LFGIGIFELLLVFFVAVIVLGPNQLPEVARTLGVWYYRLKKTAHTAQTEIEEELQKMDEGDERKP